MTEKINPTSPDKPSPQAIAAPERSRPGRVTGKLRTAIDVMVWEGASRPQAAEQAGLTDHGLRQALRRPHVLAHYRNECEVLRVSGRAKRLHRLDALALQDENKNAAVAAIKVAEQLGDEQRGPSGSVTLPGLVIQVINGPAAALPAATVHAHRITIDAIPDEPPILPSTSPTLPFGRWRRGSDWHRRTWPQRRECRMTTSAESGAMLPAF